MFPPLRNLTRACFLILLSRAALGQAERTMVDAGRVVSERVPGPPVLLERQNQPPAAVPPVRLTTPPLPPALLTRDTYQSIQVNVDALGRNIVGDAANEPSIAVDPRHPYRIVVGWRQFDSISSDFR